MGCEGIEVEQAVEQSVEERGEAGDAVRAGEIAGADAGDCDSESDAGAIERKKSRNFAELSVGSGYRCGSRKSEVGSWKLKVGRICEV